MLAGMSHPLFHIDAFTDRPFGGNPAAVCVLEEDREDAWLQSVARELNLSETAFLRRGGPVWRLRWFTPTVEVDLCGHATLASAHALWEAGYAGPDTELVFETKSGRLSAARRGEGRIELDFPAEPAVTCASPSDLLAALGVAAARSTGRNRLDYLVELDREEALRALAPDFARLSTAGGPARGVIVTAPSARPEWDFVSRYFAPAAGIDEDPVTGSAHCCLGPFWAGRLGKTRLSGYQASARGGTVEVRIGDGRVFLGGRAVTVARGELIG
jgi:PhzF family phenazine biosynthesis protein